MTDELRTIDAVDSAVMRDGFHVRQKQLLMGKLASIQHKQLQQHGRGDNAYDLGSY
jgi:hypothetical protein